MKIHPTAIVSGSAEIGEGTSIGPYAQIEDDVKIGSGCEIMQGVQILKGARIGDNCTIHHGAIISSLPQDKKFQGWDTYCSIGDNSIIREYVTISRATKQDSTTRVGKNAYLMTEVHIGHDCQIGDGVTMANLVTLAGHVTVGDLANVGGMTVIHQFVRVGKLAMVGGDSGLMMDAPPYMITFGYPPAKVYGVNTIGLKRNGISLETRMRLKTSFRLLFRSNLNYSQAIERIEAEIEPDDDVNHLLEFVRTTKRGISARGGADRMPVYQEQNGGDESYILALMGAVKSEDAIKEIVAFIESKAEESDELPT
jgi:UDP-N-acetylglucosamine acyltransferase